MRNMYSSPTNHVGGRCASNLPPTCTCIPMAERKVTNEELLDWFCVTKPIPKKEGYKPPIKPYSSTIRSPSARFEKEKMKARHHSKLPDSVYYESLVTIQQQLGASKISDDDDDDIDFGLGKPTNPNSRPGDDDYQCLTSTSVFDPYDFDHNSTPLLPILAHKDRIIDTIESNSVTVIQGSTGSGKSTQVPQYILETHARERRHCNIICTQPRRIAAVSVAKYVADCRQWRVGSLVGYQIAMDKLVSEDTRLTFVTTGVLLQKLIKMRNINQYTHVILDEVHERDKDTDFCLLLVQQLLHSNSPNVKVILMSATLKSETFANYFSVTLHGTKVPAPIVNVEGRAYFVTEFFLDSLKSIGTCELPDRDYPKLGDGMYELACKLIKSFDSLEQQQGMTVRGTVLVFLPGMPEIREMEDLLYQKYTHLNITTLPLHSSISGEDQYRVFLKPEIGKRKVILATNIAESSITVPDIKFVIDFCLVKELTCDDSTNFQCLKLNWASKASLTQRKGRAGRVSDGRCYRLITENFYIRETEQYSKPEIMRCPLESIVLYSKRLDIGEPRKILALAIEKPELHDIEKAVLNLKEVGALTLMKDGVVNPYDGDLTFLGQVLASLPVDIKIGKLLILGHVFGCLEECLVIGAALSLKPIFSQPYQDIYMESYKSKMSWANYSFSDCIGILNAYKEWHRKKSNGEFRNSEKIERDWCRRNLIKKNVIKELGELVIELSVRLRSFNIIPMRQFRYHESDEQDMLLLKLVIAGAFYPHYFRWGVSDEELANKDMSGHDPATTVMLSGLPRHSERYADEISLLFDDCGQGKYLHFEQSRVYLEFERPRGTCTRGEDPGKSHSVLDAVYISLKKRHTRNPLFIDIDEGGDNSLMGHSQALRSRDPEHLLPARLPKQGFHPIMITEVINPGHFWVQYFDESSQLSLLKLMESIQKIKLCLLSERYSVNEMKGKFCLALFSGDRMYYRGYIKSVSKDNLAQVVFVDYGNEEIVPVDFVCQLPAHLRLLPIQAFECFLAGVKPSYTSGLEGRWTTEATLKFGDIVMGKQLLLSVYSEVNNTLRIDLWDTTDPKIDVHINKYLIDKGIALFYEENLQSKIAHETLEKFVAPELKPSDIQGHNISVEWNPQRIPKSSRTKRYCLKGPNNPFEVDFYAMTRGGGLRSTKIDRQSVNCIVVDSEPQDTHERMMVAAHVAINSAGNTVLARDTTLLPNIHGLAYLVCLVFAPTVEMRTDELKRQYTGALCGLGFNPNTGMSLFPDHDIELVFDTLITQEDLDHVNIVRLAINITVGSDDIISEWGKQAVKKIQRKAREQIMNLILKSRDDVIPINSVHVGWNQISPVDVVPHQYPQAEQDGPPLLALLNGVAISGEVITASRPAERLLLLKQLEELKTKASKSEEYQYLFCNLCHVNLASPYELMLHLDSKTHKLLEKQLREELETPMPTIPTPMSPLTPSIWNRMHELS